MKDTHKWTKSKMFLIVFNCFLCLTIVVGAMLIIIDKSRIKNGVVYATNAGDTTISSAPTSSSVVANGKSTARLMCAGDNIIQSGLYKQAAERANSNGYDFSYAYAGIKDIISKSDLAFISQETVMYADAEPSSYPTYNTPPQLLDAMINAGFDVYSQATSHILDQGVKGAESDIALFKSKSNQAMLTGLYDTWENMLKPQVKTVNGLKFSFVSFSESMSDNELDSESESESESGLGLLYLDDSRHTHDELYATIQQMIETAKKNSDIVCVSVNWEDKNITSPDDSQKEIVDKLLSYGADIIIGTGAYTLQPMEFKENVDGEQSLILWSLGSFISCQESKNNMLGAIADIVVTKDNATGTTEISSAKIIPTITQFGMSYADVHIVPLSSYTEALAESHGINELDSGYTLDYINTFYNEIFTEQLETTVN